METIASLRRDLQARKGRWPQLCEDTGLNYSWVCKFSRGVMADIGLSKAQRLRAWLDANPADDEAEVARPPQNAAA